MTNRHNFTNVGGSTYGQLTVFSSRVRLTLEGDRYGEVVNQYKNTASVYLPKEQRSVLVYLPLNKPYTQWLKHVYKIVDSTVLN